ncbi:MAG: MT-A70 family methyltransferase [Bacteroidota bacterium]
MQKYNVISIDPPWQQKAGRKIDSYKKVGGKQIFNTSTNKTLNLPYNTLTVEQIQSVNIGELAADDCDLYVWVTNAYLPKVFAIIEAWGFRYSTTIVWAKNMFGGGLGGAFKINTEFLIYAKKGNLKALTTHKGTWFNIKRTYVNGYPKHSTKPTFFYELIEKISPGKKLEIFARNTRIGWDCFGNEVASTAPVTINS